MDILKKAVVQLLLSEPFFASIILNCKKIEDKTVPTACTDGKEIRYNIDFFEKCGLDGTKTVLAHEALHIAMLHTVRMGSKNHSKWNQACDYAINPILVDAGFTLPEGGLINPLFSGKSAEEIYNLLTECEKGDGGGDGDGNDPGGMGCVAKGYTTETERQQLEKEIKQIVSSAANQAKKAGKLPGSLEGLIEATLEPTVSWREILYGFVSEIAKNDYTWTMPNSRYIASGIYLPSLKSEETGNIVMIIDTSASVENYQLNQFAGELQSILADFKVGFKIIYVDTQVSNVQDVEPDEILELKVKGRGGTDYIPGFEYIEIQNLEPKCVIYFTDGECSSFPPAPVYPVLWACTDKNFVGAFGETVFVDIQTYN